MTKVTEEVVLDKEGNAIGVKELHTEVQRNWNSNECVTREIIRLHKGKIIFNRIIYRTQLDDQDSI